MDMIGLVPSHGVQFGNHRYPVRLPIGNGVISEPSEFITYSRSPPKTMCLPSGDHAAYSPPLCVNRVCPEPSAFITQMSGSGARLPGSTSFSRVEVKTILVPSGDQAGATSCPGASVNRVTPEPSAFMT